MGAEVGNMMYIDIIAGGRRCKAKLCQRGGRFEINFRYNPALIEEIKSTFEGLRWHGKDDPPRKVWSFPNTERNRFALAYLMGEDVYARFDAEPAAHTYERPLMPHQRELADSALSRHFQIWAAEMGVGKTLAAIEVMERSGASPWWWVGPKSALVAVERELKKWGCKVLPRIMTYERMTQIVRAGGFEVPQGVVFDESQKLKNAVANRTKAAMLLAESIREKYGDSAYILAMTGTPAPKSPVDWWSQAEVVFPGFIREPDHRAFLRRLAFLKQMTAPEGVKYWRQVGWRDDERKCNICGDPENAPQHNPAMVGLVEEAHLYVSSKNEIALLSERLKGLVVVKRKKDCLSLPDKIYRKVYCKPSSATLRAARTIANSAPSAIAALTLLRELSDGFQYVEKDDVPEACDACNGAGGDCDKCGGAGVFSKTQRAAAEVPCPKIEALADIFEEFEDIGRLVIFAAFIGSIDRCVALAQNLGWAVVRVDGRGWKAILPGGESWTDKPIELWYSNVERVAFIAHSESGGVGLTLTESPACVFYSNDFKPENRMQAEDRIHRPGMDEARGATIIDLIHLPTDEHVLSVLQENRRLELMTLGELKSALEGKRDEYDYE